MIPARLDGCSAVGVDVCDDPSALLDSCPALPLTDGGAGQPHLRGARATWSKRLDEAASADHTARTAPRRGWSFMQGHRLEQAAQEGPVHHIHSQMCYTEKAPNAWHPQGTPKTGNIYNQPKQPSTGTTHRPSTRHYRKGSPGGMTHNTNQHSSRARLQHSNHAPSLPTPTGSPPDPLSQRRTKTQTPPASAGTRSAPPPGAPIIRSGRWPSQGARPASEEGKGGGGWGYSTTDPEAGAGCKC